MFQTVVYGPAYLDRVVRINRPISPESTLDGSVDGAIESGGESALIDFSGAFLALKGIDEARRPLGVVRIGARVKGWDLGREVTVLDDLDDLGGMGAGYASALGGVLVSALGHAADGVSRTVSAMLSRHRIEHRPIRVGGAPADWSLIVTSGPFGDKLAVGFRGCHSAVDRIDPEPAPGCDLLVVAGLPNRLAGQALGHAARVRMFAPAMRNVTDRSVPMADLAGRFDLLCLNRREWEGIEPPDRARIRDLTPIVCITDGPEGLAVDFLDRTSGGRSLRTVPAFPRVRPPRDTNRAGEAFASEFVTTLIRSGWEGGPADPEAISGAALRGSASAALVLDRDRFGFADAGEIGEAIRLGVIP